MSIYICTSLCTFCTNAFYVFRKMCTNCMSSIPLLYINIRVCGPGNPFALFIVCWFFFSLLFLMLCCYFFSFFSDIINTLCDDIQTTLLYLFCKPMFSIYFMNIRSAWRIIAIVFFLICFFSHWIFHTFNYLLLNKWCASCWILF